MQAAGVIALCVDGEAQGLRDIGRLIDVDVADAFGVAEHGDARVGLHVFDERAGAAGDDEIDKCVFAEECGSLFAPGDESDGSSRNGGACEAAVDSGDQRGGGALDFAAGFEERRVAGLQGERSDLRDGVRSGLEDDGKHAERNRDLLQMQAVG